MKDHIRTIGIDDAAFNRQQSTSTFVFGVVVRGYSLVEGILRTKITIDGLDATRKISYMIKESRYLNQLKAIFLESSTIAAFNVIDISELYRITGIPVVVVLPKLPNIGEVKKALRNIENGKKRFDMLQKNPEINKIKFKNHQGREFEMNVQFIGLKNLKEVKLLLEKTSFTSSIPECLRLADMIGQSFKSVIL